MHYENEQDWTIAFQQKLLLLKMDPASNYNDAFLIAHAICQTFALVKQHNRDWMRLIPLRNLLHI